MSLEERKRIMAENKAAKQALAMAQQKEWTKAYNGLAENAKTSLSIDEAILHGKIEGVLYACAYCDTGDCAPEFTWCVFAKPLSLEDTLQSYYGKHNFSSINKVALDNPSDEVKKSLYEWLLNFTSLKQQMPDGIGVDGSQVNLVTSILHMIHELSKSTHVWKIDMFPIGWYACSWDDFAFENDKLVFILHLGCSD